MSIATVENWLWAAALSGEAALFFVLVRKSRWREYPAFSATILSTILSSVVGAPFYWMQLYRWYEWVYQLFAVLNILLQIAVVFELARVVLQPTGTWVSDARKQFGVSAAMGAGIALALAWMVAPPAASRLEALELRANLFSSLLICELFIAVTLASNRLGLGWRNHVMAIGQGFTAWSLVATIVDAMHSYFGAIQLYDSTEVVKSVTYLGALGYWGVQLWREEPVRQPLSPELRKFILALHKRVQYDLGVADR